MKMKLVDSDVENGKLLDFITEHDTGIQYALAHKDITMLEDIFFEYFEAQKTAYDVDKVVEQLEEKALEHAINGQQYGEDGYDTHENAEQAIKQGIEEAIEIVKSGGISD